MRPDWSFTLDLRVDQPQLLLDAARSHPDAANVLTEYFYLDDGEIDIAACLRMLLDPATLPGCRIINSSAEQYPWVAS